MTQILTQCRRLRRDDFWHIVMTALMLLNASRYQNYMEQKIWKGGLIHSIMGSRVVIHRNWRYRKSQRMQALGAASVIGLNHWQTRRIFCKIDVSRNIDAWPEADLLICCVPDAKHAA